MKTQEADGLSNIGIRSHSSGKISLVFLFSKFWFVDFSGFTLFLCVMQDRFKLKRSECRKPESRFPWSQSDTIKLWKGYAIGV